MNTFYRGDCKFVLEHDISADSIDLIYLDPPFFTGKVQKGKGKWHPEAMEISFDDTKAYWGKHQEAMRRKAPPWLNHIPRSNELKAYLFYIMERLQACKQVLKPTGSIYLHCDWRASHYLKMIMDEIFRVGNFQNEIVWHYKGRGMQKHCFQKKHDTIFLYAKTGARVFNDKNVLVPLDPAHTARYNKVDENGKSYALIKKGHSQYYSKIYLKDGIVPDDVWDIPFIHGNESVGYPTQKPLKLLERIVLASSNVGDVVLDPFCGCGTTIIAAQKHGRRWIGIDISKDAYDVSKGREHQLSLEERAEYKKATYISRDLGEVMAMKGTGDNEFEKWVNQFYGAIKPYPDKEVDGIINGHIPLQARATKEGVGSREIHTFRSSIEFHPQLREQVIKQAKFISQNGFSNDARQTVDEIEAKTGMVIELLGPEDLLRGKD